MGCTGSKQNRCGQCQAPYSPVPRTYSMHVVHPPQQRGDRYHAVAPTSTILGSLAPESSLSNHEYSDGSIDDHLNGNVNGVLEHKELSGIVSDRECKSKELSVGLIEAKSWPTLIEEKITKVAPKTPIMTPPGEPETINTWELMEGLEGVSPVHLLANQRFCSFSFDIPDDHYPVSDSPKLKMQDRFTVPLNGTKPMRLQMADGDANSKLPEFDPEIISTFRKSLEELSPDHPFYVKPSDIDNPKQTPLPGNDLPLSMSENKKTNFVAKDCKQGKEKVVLYFTSLRGVRKTYEDCCYVRVILKGLGVRVDERDVSMHSGFKAELRELLREGFGGGGLPRVFVGRKYIGGAEEIRIMHEEGQLEKVVEGCEEVVEGGGFGGACRACGDVRFVPCETCSGSCKMYYEGDELKEGEEGGGYGFQRCPDCNENGLIRCPICCC